MNLVQVRERLKAVDKALGELNRALLTAGSELSKADLMIGAVMGEGDINGRTRRKARKPVAAVDGGDAGATVERASKTLIAKAPMRRGRPRKEVEETGNSGDEAAA